MNGSDLIPWVNLFSLHVSALMFAYFSIISVMPVTREAKRGEKAWKECYWFRLIMSICIGIMCINVILWNWIPIPELAWLVHSDPFVPRFIGIGVVIPCTIILVKALRDGSGELRT